MNAENTAVMRYYVAPFAGAWIEIPAFQGYATRAESLPSRERGLKSFINRLVIMVTIVAPFAGAWIEIAKIEI